MCWLKRNLWKTGIALAGMLLLLVLMVWVPVSAAGAYERASGLATTVTGTVQATPTEDAMVTTLNKEKLTQDIIQQQHTLEDWLWNNGASLVSSLALIIAGAFTLLRYLRDQRIEREKQRDDRQTEREKRAEERFQAVVEGLSSAKVEAKIGAAILLRTFLRPDYEQFYIQAFDLAVAHLRIQGESIPPDGDPDTPLPLTTLSQVLIGVFREAFPLARSQNRGSPQSLDASGIQLDNAFFNGADLKQVWMRQASLRKAKLRGANLSEADLIRANLSGAELLETNLSRVKLRDANLSGADLSGANLDDALSLKDANLRGVKGLTKEPLGICKAKGAIIDEAPRTRPP